MEQAAESADGAHREAATLRSQVQQQLKRIGEMENRMHVLEMDNKRMVRALVREVGQDVPLETVLEKNTNSWRGRHERMIELQGKVRALQLELGNAELTKAVRTQF